jgi:hypothetical protein
MKRMKLFVLAAALTAGAFAAAPNVEADPCNSGEPVACPQIYAPVICNDGVTYPNQCYADAACAKGCKRVPIEV